jgi:predicted PurR-regulated permease PerM
MLGFDKKAARWTWTAAIVLLLLRAIYEIRETLFVLVIAVLFAYMLTPLVNMVNRFLPGKSRAPGLAITYLLLVTTLVVLGIEIGTTVAEEATSLIARGPEFFRNLQGSHVNITLPHYLEELKGNLLGRIQGLLQAHSNDILGYIPSAGLKLLSFSGYLLFVVLVPIISFFLLKDGPAIRDSLVSLAPAGPRRDMWVNILQDTNVLLGQYVRAMGLLCLATFIVFSIVFSVFGVPYAILLAAIAFPLEFIPMVGPLTAAIIIIVVTAASGYPNLLAVVIFLGVYRLFQDYVLSPRVMSSGIELHPLMVILGVLAGEKLGGVPGMFLSVPAIALVRVFYRRMVIAVAGAPAVTELHEQSAPARPPVESA